VIISEKNLSIPRICSVADNSLSSVSHDSKNKVKLQPCMQILTITKLAAHYEICL